MPQSYLEQSELEGMAWQQFYLEIDDVEFVPIRDQRVSGKGKTAPRRSTKHEFFMAEKSLNNYLALKMYGPMRCEI